ncbi:hypothetical protein OEA41_007653 [Lepraria neglecta]|uniref:DNA polymerase n=1 Tax=Lepraria neglecta TaxID=209136 RepID=A0AAD9ZDZ1_9LECA|nr:hypothetical protein OEA41_007653 [Lepraria neglecta]
MEKEKKEAFFHELYQLDDESEEEDLSDADAILRRSKSTTKARANRNRPIRSSGPKHSLGRTISAPLSQISTPIGCQAVSTLVNTSFSSIMARKAQKDEVLDTPHDGSQPSKAKGSAKDNGKRKRGQSLALLPESQQIFKGLIFFFFPNNNVAPARGFRIRKAMEWGAVWAEEWKSTITHVIVDKNLCYKDLLWFLKLDALPPEAVLVNETYPSDCIIYRFLVNPNQHQYRITGHEEAQAIKDLPLDFDEDESPEGSFNFDESDEDHSEDEKKTKTKLKNSFNKSWQENFNRMAKQDGKGKSENPNARTIEVLQLMAEHYDRMHDHWRLTAYRRAIAALRKQSTKIISREEAFAIPFIGERLAKKVEEIVWTNRLKRLENANLEPNDEVFQLFLKIYGVGYAQATKWIDQGHRNIDDLLAKAQLTKNQKIGIEHFDDFQTRIPRAEMDRHDQYIRETCNKIDASIQFIIGGSYRRGAADSRDVDFIVTKPNCSIDVVRNIMLETMIPKLFDNEYLKVGLATTAKADGSKWHGASALPGTSIWRRIDFLFVPWEELGAALIYFTGNDIFNRSLRLLASKKGMRLNQRGLYKDVIRGKNRERITQGTLVEGKDEKRIFELLDVPWRPPHYRIY